MTYDLLLDNHVQEATMDLIIRPEIVDYNSGVLTAFSPTMPSGEIMRLTLRLPDNPVSDRLMMQISESEGARIAEMMRDSTFAFRAEPESIPHRERNSDASAQR
jgi:hypothetical protein